MAHSFKLPNKYNKYKFSKKPPVGIENYIINKFKDFKQLYPNATHAEFVEWLYNDSCN